MNKLRTAWVLMAATVLLLTGFQAYWMRKLYSEEKDNFRKTTDVIFRDAMYRLQAQRFTGDTLAFRGTMEDNLFMADFISTVEKIKGKGDSSKPKLVISMNTHAERKVSGNDSGAKKEKGDTVIYVSSQKNGLPPPDVEDLVSGNKSLSDSIPVKRIDSMFKAMLSREGVNVGFRIIKNNPVMLDSMERKFTLKINDTTSVFTTRLVPVGLLNPVFYRAEFTDPGMYIFKKMGKQLLLSVLLIGLTIVSFVFIYRNLLAQKKLTDIKNEFIGNITHELKTPISTVSVAIEAMKNFDALQSPERTKEYLGIAGNELNRLSLLVDKVLRLSMFETQQVELKYEWFDIQPLLKEVLSSMQLQFEKTGATVRANFKGDDFSIMADRMHITSVVYNLLDNALKYSKGKPEIDLAVESKENEMVLSVKDNGIGIPASYKEKIFDKFFRVPHGDKHNVKGYGLGLSYVAHIIAGHKGSLQVDSEEGKGTTFTIKLPKENAG